MRSCPVGDGVVLVVPEREPGGAPRRPELRPIGSKGRVRFLITKFNKPDLQALADLLESGALMPAIDRTYELAEAQDALRTFGEGHVRGMLVFTI